MKYNRRHKLHYRRHHNNGFTLVELVVVLALVAILLSVTIFGGLAWQDWMRFQNEDSIAEEIFYAAQNQLIELEASGSIERTVIRPLQDGNVYAADFILAQKKPTESEGVSELYDTKLTRIIGSTGTQYSWDSIWNSSSGALRTNTNQLDTLSIIKLTAKSGSYKTYLEYKKASLTARREILESEKANGFNAGTVVLFDLISSYISDDSALEGAIALEFSPETRQVFSALYSDQASELSYGEGAGVSVLDRQQSAREPLMLGYYGVERLTERIRGKGMTASPVRLEIRNEEVLSLVLRDNEGDTFTEGVKFRIKIYDGDDLYDEKAVEAMSFVIPYSDDIPAQNSENDMLPYAAGKPVLAEEVKINMGKYRNTTKQFRFPVWIEDGDIHIALDAADVQAQTSVYSKAANSLDDDSDEAKAFRNTYSFYRFGLSSDVNYIYASVQVIYGGETDESESVFSGSGKDGSEFVSHKDLQHENGSYGECATFAAYSVRTEEGGSKTKCFDITNARHLYNVRYETELKSLGMDDNEFRLKADIDWNEFTNRNKTGKHNYFLNSYDSEGINDTYIKAGIGYKGNNKATGGSGVASDIITDTDEMPFPSFRCLSVGDSFIQDHPYGEDGSYLIKNIDISFAANVVYGIYDDVIKKVAGDPSFEVISGECIEGDFSGLLGLKTDNLSNIDSTRSGLALAGALPLGLFCENLGTLRNITLDDHVVRGMEDGLDDSGKLIYTCMVGGFTGDNLGVIDGLTLLSTNGRTHINGRKDVGGILGRQSFVASIITDKEVTISGMKNYGMVTGMENVGGIVGRVYVDYLRADGAHYYVGEDDFEQYDLPQAGLFHDGYYITDNSRSMTDTPVSRASSVLITNCENYGRVSGDDLLISNAIDAAIPNNSGTGITYNTDVMDSRCAFIGGIAGAAMDGLIYSGSNVFAQPCSTGANQETKENSSVIRAYSGEPLAVIIDGCSSYVTYSDDELSPDNKVFTRDSYVGGIVGYARRAELKNLDQAQNADFVENGVSTTFVLGNSYVGGIAGCSDMTKYTAEGSYNAVNNNTVIGRKCVGGIAGAFGVGDSQPDTFSLRDPAGNEASMPSGVLGERGLETASRLLNAGIVLSLKTSHPFSVDTDEANASAACGGIVGAAAHALYNCDNIQTEDVKGHMLSMITGGAWESVDDIDIDELESLINSSVYGGCGVGGLAGWVRDGGLINSNSTASDIDAIVFGEDYVGGAVGYASASDEVNMYNCLPYKASGSTGMYVLGTDIVGGILGESRGIYALSGDNSIQDGYNVLGRYAVGGISGRTVEGAIKRISFDTSMTDKVKVSGIAYVGGCTGLIDGDSTFTVALSKMDVTGKYFAGGLAGAVAAQNADGTELDMSFLLWMPENYITTDNTVHVKAGAYAGGTAGIYANVKKNFTSLNGSGNKDGSLLTMLSDLGYTGSGYPDSDKAYSEVADKDIKGTIGTFANSSDPLLLEFDVRDRHKASVEAEIFAGGLFGYVPNDQPVTILGFVNEGSVRTTGYVGETSGKRSADAYDSNTKISYLGSVVGRVQKKMVLQNCSNTVSGKPGNAEGKYYYADNASFLGGLTEVNAGVIQGEVKDPGSGGSYDTNTNDIIYSDNNTDYDYSGSNILSVGAFAGINGTRNTDGTNTGIIRYCRNMAGIKAASTAGIAAASGGKSLIAYSENRGRILCTDEDNGAAAGIAGIAVSGIAGNKSELAQNIRIISCVNLGEINLTPGGEKIEGHSAGIVYDTGGCGDIELCRNYGTGEEYAISGTSAAKIYANFEMGGLGADDSKDPIAPSGSTVFARNFYCYGSHDHEDDPEDVYYEDRWSKRLYHTTDPLDREKLCYTFGRNGVITDEQVLEHGELVIEGGFFTPDILCVQNTETDRLLAFGLMDVKIQAFLKNDSLYSNEMFVGGN